MQHPPKSRINEAHPTGVQGQCTGTDMEKGQGAVATGVALMAEHNAKDHTRYRADFPA
jgi:hypothetical protein